MKKNKSSWMVDRMKSFRYAFSGIARFYSSQVNAKIHLLAAVIAVTAGIILEISSTSWCIIVLSIGFVLSAEMFNTSIELVSDSIYHGKNENAAKIKDIAAGAVLVSAIAALLTGLLIFIPALLSL